MVRCRCEMNDANDIQQGSKVVLRSGGAEMIVLSRSQNLAVCSWEEDGVMRQGTFELVTLKPADLPAGEPLLREAPIPAQEPVVALMPQPEGDAGVQPAAGEPPEVP